MISGKMPEEAMLERIDTAATMSLQQRLALKKKPIRSRVDYNFFNYCSTCNLKYSKDILRCPECKQKVRTKPWHRSRVVQLSRI